MGVNWNSIREQISQDYTLTDEKVESALQILNDVEHSYLNQDQIPQRIQLVGPDDQVIYTVVNRSGLPYTVSFQAKKYSYQAILGGIVVLIFSYFLSKYLNSSG